VDIFVSSKDEEPTFDNAEWLSDVDGDDSICISVCNQTEGATSFTLFVGIATASNEANFSIVATTTLQTALIPISGLGLSSSTYMLSYRAFSFECPAPYGTVDCSFAVYPDCRKDGYGCCDRIRPIPPTAEASPLWPWDESDPTFPSTSIPVSTFDRLVPGKLAFAVTLRRYAQNSFFAPISSSFGFDQAKQCRINLNGVVMDATGAGVIESLSFTPETLICDSSSFAEVWMAINDTINGMYQSFDGANSLLLHHRLSALLMSSRYRACKSLVDGFITRNASAVAIFSSSSSCFASVGSVAYEMDPCCNQTLALLSQCCNPRMASFPLGEPGQIETAAVTSSCAASTCSTKTLQNYMAVQSISNTVSACNDIQSEYTNSVTSTNFVQFIYDCQLATVGTDLRGLPCENSTQCPNGRACNSGHCAYTTDDILDCLVDKISPPIARFLLLSWGLGNAPFSKADMKTQLRSRIVSPQCFGKDAIQYRSHFWYHTEILCNDDCTNQGLEPRCFDETTCPIDPSCILGGTYCSRYWEPIPDDLESCAEQKLCSWMSCDGLSAADCEAACLNATLSPSACVKCNGDTFDGRCSEVAEIADQNRCSVGLCSTNASLSDASACAATGTCSVACATCDTEPGCSSAGSCSDSALEPFVINGGVCVEPFVIIDGILGCENTSLAVASGCVSPGLKTQTDCSSLGSFWHVPASNASACASQVYGCFDVKDGFTLKTEQQCRACGDEWRPVYAWTDGQWTSGTMLPLYWVERQYLNATYIADSVDFFGFRALVKDAISTRFSVAVASDAQCRYAAQLKQVAQITCDCSSTSSNRGLACYSGQSLTTTESAGWACPFIAANISSRTASLQLSDSSITTSSCAAVNIQVVSALQFKSDPTAGALSSAVFQRTSSNPYAIVTNSEGLYIGQLLSDGVRIASSTGASLKLDDSALLCIVRSDAISEIDSSFSIFGFGTLQDDSSIRPVANLTVTPSGNSYCARITSPSQVFFIVALEQNWEASSSQAQYIIGSVLYILVAALGLFQGAVVLIFRTLAWERKTVFILFTLVFQIRTNLSSLHHLLILS
jgi:hypothetical protein